MATRTIRHGTARSATSGGRRASSREAYRALVGVLGAGHPLTRAQLAVDVATDLAVHASALLFAAPCLTLVSRSVAGATEASAAVVAAALWGTVALIGACRRERVHDLILAGAPSGLEVIRSEIRRLLDPTHCARIGATLDAALHEGEHWHEYLPASRPPAGVRHLPPNGWLIRDITARLREAPASPRAMVLLHRLVQGGYGAAVYQGGPEWARRELGRIRFELLQPVDPEQF